MRSSLPSIECVWVSTLELAYPSGFWEGRPIYRSDEGERGEEKRRRG
jgi:hypothetical protein